MSQSALLLKFKEVDTANTVTRATLKKMSEVLGFNDTQLVQYALAQLRAQVLPAYEADEGALSATTVKKLRKLVDEAGYKPDRSLLPGL
jgi:hypothetical protein